MEEVEGPFCILEILSLNLVFIKENHTNKRTQNIYGKHSCVMGA